MCVLPDLICSWNHGSFLSHKKKKRKENSDLHFVTSNLSYWFYITCICGPLYPIPQLLLLLLLFSWRGSLWSRRACECLKRLDSYRFILPSLRERLMRQSFSGGTELSPLSLKHLHLRSSDEGESNGSGRTWGRVMTELGGLLSGTGQKIHAFMIYSEDIILLFSFSIQSSDHQISHIWSSILKRQ